MASTTNLAAFNPLYNNDAPHGYGTNPVLAKELVDLERGEQLKVVESFSTWAKLKAQLGFSGAMIAGAALFSMVTLAVVLGAVLGTRAAENNNNNNNTVTFRIIHMNDMHARVEGIVATESAASNADRIAGNKSDGGWPKIFTASKLMVQNTTNPVIFLEDGDQHMGSIWHTYYKGREAWEFLNVLCGPTANGGAGFAACVGGIGNHEFDGQYYNLLEYVRNINYQMVSSNIDDTCAQNAFGPMAAAELGSKIAKYTVITLPNAQQTKVGIVGYLTPETKSISSPPQCIDIPNEVTAVTAAVDALKAQGVKIIIALGHSGYAVDQTIAATIPDIDVVVGGHSHTFLWDNSNGPSPGMSDAGLKTNPISGSYPTIVAAPGNVFGVPVVQAYWGSRFLGSLDLTFDNDGKLTGYNPNLVILGDDGPFSKATNQYADDPVANGIITALAPALDTFRNQVIGQSAITATALRADVRVNENIVGNMVCDAMMFYMKNVSNFGAVDYCLMNSGGVRAGINAGNVRVADVLSILPFNNVMAVLRLTGRQLYIMAEHGLGRWNTQQGEFPQIGGFHVVFNSTKPQACNAAGVPRICNGTLPAVSRVMYLYNNKTGELVPNDNSKTYKMVTNDFTARGGDSYAILTETTVLLGTGAALDEAFRVYVQSFGSSGITGRLEERIVNCALTPSSRFCLPPPSQRPSASPITSRPSKAPSKSPTEYQGDVTFRIIHMNDMHARVEGIVATESAASNADRIAGNKSDGGWPKIFTASKLMVQNTTNPVIFLEDGDQHMGSIWHTYYKGREAWEFLNVLCGPTANGGAGFAACVGGIGNHEFDGQYYNLLEYVRNINYQMVSSNIDDTCAQNAFGPMAAAELGSKIAKYTVITLPNAQLTKVGIVGYLTPETKSISSPPQCIDIPNEVTAVTAAVDALKAQGVKIIIALGHSGYAVDQTIAATIPDIDVVVGGHSHTFLWDNSNGPSPGMSDAGLKTNPIGGSYPTIVAAPGNVFGVPVVQAYWGSRFLGSLDLTFDNDGKLTGYNPNLVILGDDGPFSKATNQYADDPVANGIITALAPALDTFRNQVIGQSAITATALRADVRVNENIVGNMVCDAMMFYMKNVSNFGAVDYCLMNSGGVRAGINAGNVRVADVLSILPFNNVMAVLQLTGRQLYIMAEHGLGRWNTQQGEFPQIGGFHVVFNSTKPQACNAAGVPRICNGTLPAVSRVMYLYNNKTGELVPNDNSKTYKMVTNDFTARGGDSYAILTETTVLLGTGAALDEAFRVYVQSFGSSGITGRLEERIVNCALTPSSRFCIPPVDFSAYDVIPTITANPAGQSGRTVKIRGLVTLDLRSTSARGFYVQANKGQHPTQAAAGSEAIFVDCYVSGGVVSPLCASTAFDEGFEVEVDGVTSTTTDSGVVYARILQTDDAQVSVLCSDPQTTIAGTQLKLCDTVNIRTVTFPLPATTSTALLPALGMVVDFAGVVGGKFIISDNYDLGQYGQLGMSATGDILKTPTQVYPPGVLSSAYATDNLRNYMVLDDGNTTSNTRPTFYPLGGLADSATNTLRAGSKLAVSALQGLVIIDRRFAEFRLHPNKKGRELIPAAIEAPDDPRGPPNLSGRGIQANDGANGYIRIVGMNLLNYFTTLGSRGAQTAPKFAVQQDRLFESIKQMRPAIIAVQEIENGNTASDALVAGLNAAIDGANYMHVATGTVGGDEIKVGIVYDANIVTPVGAYATYSYINPADKSRPSVAQTFYAGCSNDKFTVVSNHFKSKGASSCTGADCDSTLGGEGNWGNARLAHAQQLRDWLATDPTGSGSPKFVALGDFNSYRFERSIAALTAAGYVDIASRDNTFPYSYSFDGQFGTLDYAIASPSMADSCGASLEWHNNSPEPAVLSYEFDGVATSPFRASDHDPFILGCQLCVTKAPSTPTLPAPSMSPTTPAPVVTSTPTTPQPVVTAAPTLWSAFVNEFHANNAGADVGEFVEIAVKATVDISTVTVQLINGGVTPVASYDTKLGSVFTKGSKYCAGTENEFDLYSYAYPTNGVQNSGTSASPDSIYITVGGVKADHVSYNPGQTLTFNGDTSVAINAITGMNADGSYPLVSPANGISRTGTQTVPNFAAFVWDLQTQTPGTINSVQIFTC